jgi:copper chaperone CopZ
MEQGVSIIVKFDSASISKKEIKEGLEKSGYKFVRLTR